jgi:hypothetical protein
MRTLDQIRKEIHERQKWSLADQNRDSAMFLQILDELATHIQKLKDDLE